MSEELFTFPCDFPIKIIGKNGDQFETAVLSIIRKHVPDLHENALKYNKSKQGKFISITVMIRAVSRKQLDKIYQDLTDCDEVIMAL